MVLGKRKFGYVCKKKEIRTKNCVLTERWCWSYRTESMVMMKLKNCNYQEPIQQENNESACAMLQHVLDIVDGTSI